MTQDLEPVFEELNGSLGGLVGYREHDGDEGRQVLVLPEQVMAGMGMGRLAHQGLLRTRGQFSRLKLGRKRRKRPAGWLPLNRTCRRGCGNCCKSSNSPRARKQVATQEHLSELAPAGEEFELPCSIN